jgi:hypothetical protein
MGILPMAMEFHPSGMGILPMAMVLHRIGRYSDQ